MRIEKDVCKSRYRYGLGSTSSSVLLIFGEGVIFGEGGKTEEGEDEVGRELGPRRRRLPLLKYRDLTPFIPKDFGRVPRPTLHSRGGVLSFIIRRLQKKNYQIKVGEEKEFGFGTPPRVSSTLRHGGSHPNKEVKFVSARLLLR